MLEIRAAEIVDAESINKIYNHYVLNSLVTFDIEPTEAKFWAEKIRRLQDIGLPFLVACSGLKILGFAYASPWRPKAAYRQSVEDTIYLAPDAVGQGFGNKLFEELIEKCRAANIREMIAVISAEGAESSIALHQRFGFATSGHLANVGYKFDRWLGTVLMQKSL